MFIKTFSRGFFSCCLTRDILKMFYKNGTRQTYLCPFEVAAPGIISLNFFLLCVEGTGKLVTHPSPHCLSKELYLNFYWVSQVGVRLHPIAGANLFEYLSNLSATPLVENANSCPSLPHPLPHVSLYLGASRRLFCGELSRKQRWAFWEKLGLPLDEPPQLPCLQPLTCKVLWEPS